MQKHLLTILILNTFLFAQSQTDYVYYSPADGLVQSHITTLFQDSKGYIWIGTQGGLSKFDGFEFINYTTFEGLAENYIVKILEDVNGNIWVLNRKSVNKYQNNKFTSFTLDSASKFQDFEIDNENKIWILDVGFYKQTIYSFDNNKFRFFQTFNNQWIFDLFYSLKNKSLLSISDLGVFSIPDSSKFQYTDNKNFKYCFSDKLGNTYFVSDDSISMFNNNIINTTLAIKPNSKIKTRLKTGEFISFNQNSNAIYSFISEKTTTKITDKQGIIDILIDNQENIWVGSENGLYRITAFQNFTDLYEINHGLTSIVEDAGGNIWFTSSYQFSSDKRSLSYYNYKQNDIKLASPKLIEQIVNIEKPTNSKNFAFNYGAIKLSNGTVVFTTNQNFIYLFKEQKFKKIQFDALDKQYCIYEDTSNNKIFIGTSNGIFITKPDFKTFEMINNFSNTNYQPVTDIEKGADGKIYFCTSDGIGIYNYKNTTFLNQDSIPITGAMTIYKDYTGNLWFGALNGLFVYDYNYFTKVNHPELKTNITAINGSNNHTLIIGSVRGIGLLNLNTMYQNQDTTVRFYDKSSGFLGVEVILNGIFKDSKDNIWVATKSHIVKFNPKKLTENLTPPITLITQKTFSDKNLKIFSIHDSISTLDHSNNNISISYTGISYRSPEQVIYKYQLKGYDKAVSPPTKKRTATYTNLPPGNYVFKVWACNESGIWNDNPTEWSFEIQEALWQKTWFKYIYVSAIVLLTFLITLGSVRFIYKRREHKRKIIDLQFHSFSNQLYPHFLYNAIANISGAIYTHDQDTAYDYTTKLTALIRQVQEDQKSIQRCLKDELVFVEKFIKIQKFRFGDRFEYEFKIDPKINLSIKVPQMIIQTFVENAIKHGLEHLESNGKLLIDGSLSKNTVVFAVQDNGMGFEASKNIKKINSGQGLKIINEIIKLYNSRYKTNINYKIIDLHKYKLNGTRVEILIPSKIL